MEFRAFAEYAVAVGRPESVGAVRPEEQNSDYESGVVEIDGGTWHLRTARTTPTKPGAFLAFWRRDGTGGTAPFAADAVGAGLIVLVEQAGRRGAFRFTAEHLSALGITAGPRPGKRGFRVYPGWCGGLNPSATATQRAQAPAFDEY
ncbi:MULTISPECIES: MepB family protein [unclassified Leucobacter]|uniref:MepB family protein n=1 Tax=unclassified Leucobacter TaxID=2621730 RepID=UPI0006224500|nr:MepB family protein [Leucobacter sp. Ag1]KKI16621.1 metallopeptidase [Leucobacter sp. Ag1]